MFSFSTLHKNRDEWYTQKKAVDYLMQFLPSPKKCGVIWDPSPGPFGTRNSITWLLADKGYDVIVTKEDFMKVDAPPHSNVRLIITNPPFSLKNKFIWKSMELGLPYLFLLPLHSLDSEIRCGWWRSYGLQLFIIPEHLSFTDDNGKSSKCSFNISWFGWRVTSHNSSLEFLKLIEDDDL